MTIDPKLADRIYEAAVLPDRWPAVLQEIADGVGARGAILNFAGDKPRFVPSTGFASVIEDYVAGGHTSNEARLVDLHRKQFPGFQAETAHRTQEELDALPIFRDFLKPRGLGGAAATSIQGVGDTAMHVAVEFGSHAEAERAVPLLDPLRPDLARSLSLSAKVETLKTEAMVTGLETAGAAAAIVGADGRLRAANTRFVARTSATMMEGRQGFTFADTFLRDRFAAALARHRAAAGGIQSIAIADADGGRPFALHILPITGAAREQCDSDGVLLLLAEAENASVPGADLLRLLFDLTPAEARLTRLLVEGHAPAAAAARLGIREMTARTHLRNIFAKTGVKRQTDLTRLLLGMGAPG